MFGELKVAIHTHRPTFHIDSSPFRKGQDDDGPMGRSRREHPPTSVGRFPFTRTCAVTTPCC